MLELLRGQRQPVDKLCGSTEIELELYHKADFTIDCSCFGLDAAGKLSDERYFIFYNQSQSPEGAVRLLSGTGGATVRFSLSLNKLPSTIARLAFTAAIDGTRTMRDLSKGHARFLQNGAETARYSYTGAEFQGERAVVICEFYRRDGGWRVNPVGRGFNGGLKALVESYGGQVEAPAPPSPDFRAGEPRYEIALSPEAVRRMETLTQLCRGETDYLRGLYKSMFAGLALLPMAASRDIQTVLCADVSGSMYDLYRNGRVQRIIDKFFVFGTSLRDACSMDFWAFGAKSRQFSPITMDNVRSYTFEESGGFERWMSMVNYQYNNEPEAMRDIMMIYGGLRRPVFVLFLTDGRLSSDWEIEEILIKTSRFPLFWQFVGVHGSEYGILERLDEIDGRHTANAGFFKCDDIDDLSDSALYSRLLGAVCGWTEELNRKKMLERNE